MRPCTLAPSLVATLVLIAAPAAAKTVNVTNATELTAALSSAVAGDEIVLAAGTYPLTSSPSCAAAGTVAMPIVVRSATPLGAKIEFDAVEGFHVLGPFWHFEGLDIHGVCANDSDCEHAFHVVGEASGFVMRNNRVVDFNAQLKVNAAQVNGPWFRPNGGLVEGNEIFDTHSRATSNPVTKLNIDGVDSWIVRANIIHDGHKNGGDNVSYQSFMKGGGQNGLYERNLVICSRDDTSGGTRIGLSFGGGGTGAMYCAPAFDANVPCDPEMTGSTMRNNIIVNCSDVAIYLNKAKDSHILYNTMIATNGVDFRFASTSGEADGNILDSNIRTRDGGGMTLKTNLTGLMPSDFIGWYVGPLIGDLRKKGDLSQLLGKGPARGDVTNDYCLRTRSGAYDLGALQSSLGDCDTLRPPTNNTPPGDDAGVNVDASIADSGGVDGSKPTGDSSPNSATPAVDAGCGCDVASPQEGRGGVALVALAMLAIVRRRRRPNPKCPLP